MVRKKYEQEIKIVGVFNYLNSVTNFIELFNDRENTSSINTKKNLIKLVLEPENIYDNNAVAVLINNKNNIFYEVLKNKGNPSDRFSEEYKEYHKIGYLNKNEDDKIKIIEILKEYKDKGDFYFEINNLGRIQEDRKVFIETNLKMTLEILDKKIKKTITNKKILEKINNIEISL